MPNGKQTMCDVLAFKKLENTPHWLMGLEYSNSELAQKLDVYFKNNSWRNKLNSCIFGTHIGFIREKPKNGYVRDTFGVLLQVGNITHSADLSLKKPDLSGFKWPNPEEMVDWDDLNRQINTHKDCFQLWGPAMGLFERGWLLRGSENFLMDMIEEEQFVHDLLDGITNVHLKFIDTIYAHAPIDAIFGGDDVCDQRGVIMGIERWRKFFKPRLKQVIDRAHKHGLPYIAHSCGNVLPLVDDLIEIGLDGLETLQPEVMDLTTLKQKANGKLALIGGMGVQNMLYYGTAEEIRNETHRLKKILGKNGGYVLAPSKTPEHEPVENIAAFIEAILEHNHH
jgi:uroporphyrinogen decarboxylase